MLSPMFPQCRHTELIYNALSDNLLYSVLSYCGVRWQYKFPNSSPISQGCFDEHLGRDVRDICQEVWQKLVCESSWPLRYAYNKELLFISEAESIRFMFPAVNQSFIRMVHVAMLAAFFIKKGFADACSRAFCIINRYAKEFTLFVERTFGEKTFENLCKQ